MRRCYATPVPDWHLERSRPWKLKTDDDLERIVLDGENSKTEFNLDHGVFVKMKRSEIEVGEELLDDYEAAEDRGGFRRRREEEDD